MVFKFKMSGVNEYQRVRHRENCPLGKDLAAWQNQLTSAKRLAMIAYLQLNWALLANIARKSDWRNDKNLKTEKKTELFWINDGTNRNWLRWILGNKLKVAFDTKPPWLRTRAHCYQKGWMHAKTRIRFFFSINRRGGGGEGDFSRVATKFTWFSQRSVIFSCPPRGS